MTHGDGQVGHAGQGGQAGEQTVGTVIRTGSEVERADVAAFRGAVAEDQAPESVVDDRRIGVVRKLADKGIAGWIEER